MNCTKCKVPVKASDNYCPGCGKHIEGRPAHGETSTDPKRSSLLRASRILGGNRGKR